MEDSHSLGHFRPGFTADPVPHILFLGLGFALLNAALEETIWRGVILTFIYGLILGQARISAAGLLLPTLMHFTADLIIFLLYALSR